jgi:hypothetical protein
MTKRMPKNHWRKAAKMGRPKTSKNPDPRNRYTYTPTNKALMLFEATGMIRKDNKNQRLLPRIKMNDFLNQLVEDYIDLSGDDLTIEMLKIEKRLKVKAMNRLMEEVDKINGQVHVIETRKLESHKELMMR